MRKINLWNVMWFKVRPGNVGGEHWNTRPIQCWVLHWLMPLAANLYLLDRPYISRFVLQYLLHDVSVLDALFLPGETHIFMWQQRQGCRPSNHEHLGSLPGGWQYYFIHLGTWPHTQWVPDGWLHHEWRLPGILSTRVFTKTRRWQAVPS